METALARSIQDRILKEMLGAVKDGTGAGWKALVLDPVTTKILSSAVKMGDILECNVSVVEDLHKDREPLPLVGVYFIQPTSNNIDRLLEDFADVKPLYPSVHIFFSSQVRQKLLDKIKDCPPLLRVLKSLKETNLEYLLVDSRTVITDVMEDTEGGLIRLMGPAADARSRDADLNVIVTRLTTLFSTLKDFPVIRYMLPRPPLPTDPPGAKGRSTLTQRMATALLEKLVKLQQAGTLPNRETCDMLILDRSYDPLAPIIHEWTYEAMVYDLLPIDGNIFRYQPEESSAPPAPAKGKQPGADVKEVTIDERDPMWVELRHIFIAEVYSAIATRFKEFQSKNKAAKVAGSGIKDKANDMTLGSIRGLISALPQFHDILSRMSLHIQMSSDLKKVTNQRLLTDLGELEQDLVLGEKTSKEMTAYLAEVGRQLQPEDKLRLLMSYVATHPERMDNAKREEWMALAGLGSADMDAVSNLAYLGVQVAKLPAVPEGRTGSFFSKKGKKEDKAAIRQPRQEEENYALFRFDPLLRNIVTDMHSNRLPLEQYPYIRTPSPEAAADLGTGVAASAASARTRPGSLNWTKRGQAGAEGGAAGSSGRRLIIFILGGAVRSEMRLAHQLSQQLGRDIILASSSIETPITFLDQLRRIGTQEAAEM